MSSRHYEELWRRGMEELVGLLDAEHPEDPAAAPKSLEEWARLYIRYVRAFRRLSEAHDGVAHPQKRRALRGALEACAGRVLELRAWLAQLNGGVHVVGDVLGGQLAALGLTPEALELPVPACFREAREGALAGRAAAAAAAAAQAAEAGSTAATGGAAGEEEEGEEEQEAESEAEAASAPADSGEAAEQGEAGPGAQQGDASPPAAPASTAGAFSGQQGQDGLPAAADGASASPELEARRHAAATTVQACVRGWLARQRVAEQEFLGMLPPADSTRSAELAQRVASIAAERKQRQAARQAELDAALLSIKAGVCQRERWAVKNRIRDQLNDWFLKSRNPQTGEYPDLPEAAQGGSRNILRPPPPQPTPEEAAAAAAAAAKAGKAAAGKGGKGGAAAGAPEPPRLSQAFLEGLQGAVEQYLEVWQEHEPRDPTLALLPPELQGLPQPRGGSGADRFDARMVEEQVRPVVEEELRLEADDEMRALICSIKDMIQAERAGRKKKGGGKKGDKKGGGKKSGGGKGEGAGAKKAAAAGGADGKKGGAPAKKKRKDLTAGRSIESLFAELAAAGLVRPPAAATAADFLGGDRLVPLADTPGAAAAPPPPTKPKTGGKKANAAAAKPAAAPGGAKGKAGAGGAAAGAGGAAGEPLREYPLPSLAEARQAVVASCILPLGAHPSLAKAQAPRAVLLYGPTGSGKSLLARAVAHQAGATVFDLSPAATAGKYAGKAAATMVHMVFKVARALAPSVVLLEEVDQVFVSDKTRAKALAPPGGEPPNRIKKQLLAEAADLEPGDGVLLLCTSSQPQACVRKDERALRTLAQRFIQLPLPDHGGRAVLLQAFAQRERLDLGASLSLLVQLTEGLSAGQLQAFVAQLAAGMRRGTAQPTRTEQGEGGAAALAGGEPPGSDPARQSGAAGTALQELALELLPGFSPAKAGDLQALQEWTARVHSPLPPEEAPQEGAGQGKKKKKKN